MNAPPQVGVVIVNYQTAEIVGGAVESALAQQGVGVDVVVVDNASTDGSAEVLRRFGARIRLIESAENVGFGRGCNIGAATTGAPYVFLLNPDARFDSVNALARLAAFMEGNAKVALSAPRVLNPDGSDQAPPRLRYPGQRHVSIDFSALPGRIAWFIGAAMMIRKTAFDASGGFDPDYFLYAEETDLCLRLRKAGWELAWVKDVTVTHVGGASERKLPSFEVWMKKQAGLHLFYAKSYPPEDAKKLFRRESLRARWRLSLLGVKKAVFGLGREDEGKVAKYRAMRDSAERSLNGPSRAR